MNSLVTVGIFDPKVVDYAVNVEFGDRGTSFIRATYDSYADVIGDYIVGQYELVISKRITLDTARKNVGAFIVNLIRDTITKKDLIKTGRMLNSVEAK